MQLTFQRVSKREGWLSVNHFLLFLQCSVLGQSWSVRRPEARGNCRGGMRYLQRKSFGEVLASPRCPTSVSQAILRYRETGVFPLEPASAFGRNYSFTLFRNLSVCKTLDNGYIGLLNLAEILRLTSGGCRSPLSKLLN